MPKSKMANPRTQAHAQNRNQVEAHCWRARGSLRDSVRPRCWRDGGFLYFICTFMPTQEEPAELCRVPADGGEVEHVIPRSVEQCTRGPCPRWQRAVLGKPDLDRRGAVVAPEERRRSSSADWRGRRVRGDLRIERRPPRRVNVAGRPTVAGRDSHCTRRERVSPHHRQSHPRHMPPLLFEELAARAIEAVL